MNLMPNTKSPLLRLTVVLMALVCFGYASALISQARQGSLINPIFGLFFFVPLGVGLWRMRSTARILAIITALVTSVILFVGQVNPFAILEENPAHLVPLWVLVVRVMAPIGILLSIAFVLNNQRQDFKP